MIVFIEGPDHDSKNILYNQLVMSQRSEYKKNNVYFYDTQGGCNAHSPYEIKAKIEMAMDLNNRYESFNMVVNAGPISLIADAFKSDDIDLIRDMTSIFGCVKYQRIALISVSCGESAAERDSYRSISSRHMSVISDAGKSNSYRYFTYRNDPAVTNLFNSDVIKLINN